MLASMLTKPHIKKQARRDERTGILVSVAFALALFCLDTLMASDAPVGSEAQVKALFLFNFAKYVDWPSAAFSNATAPITIGLMGSRPLGENLQHIIEDKEIHGHSFVIKQLAAGSDLSGCQILFISHSEASGMREILKQVSALPILTAGEDEEFAREGGIINFVLKNGKVRLEINLAAARKAGLTISSRLLAVADVVTGKTN